MASRPREAGDGEQQGYIDARVFDAACAPPPSGEREHDEDSVGSDGDESPTLPGLIQADALMFSGHAPPPEEPPVRRQRQRRRIAAPVGAPARGSDPAEDLMTSLERHLESTGGAADDPGRCLARSFASSSMAMIADQFGGQAPSGDVPKS